MAVETKVLLRVIDELRADASLDYQTRQRAAYISASFSVHANKFRLMAQAAALDAGEFEIPSPHLIHNPDENTKTLVQLHGKNLQAVMSEYDVKPGIGDFEGHPVNLFGMLDGDIDTILEGEKLAKFHRALLRAETNANNDLARATKKYGYHYIFRVGLSHYYLAKTIAEHVNFWKTDDRGVAYGAQTQALCYRAMERRICLNGNEKSFIVRMTKSRPEDARRFWSFLEHQRAAYTIMRGCIALL
ncbi:putative mating locus protein, partial [Aspergillus indologenus CBS 114.80]